MHRQDYLFDVLEFRAVDGDTIEATVDLGFRATFREKFRVARINAPELRTAPGEAAKDFLQALLESAATIIVASSKTEKYGRWLGDFWVYLEDGTKKNISEEMVASGHAIPYGKGL